MKTVSNIAHGLQSEDEEEKGTLALLLNQPGLNPCTTYGFQAPPRVNTGCRDRSKPSVLTYVVPKQNILNGGF